MNRTTPWAVALLFLSVALVSAGCASDFSPDTPTTAHTPTAATPSATSANAASLTPLVTPRPTRTPTSKVGGRSAIYWGAYVLEDGQFAPFEPKAIDKFESIAQKKMSILHWGQPWWDCHSNGKCGYEYFGDQVKHYELVRQRGMIPMLDWGSFYPQAPSTYTQTQFTLQSIIDGAHDEFLNKWATQAKDWGHPFFLRFDWEMNGDWYPWSEARNTNKPGDFAKAWRHVHGVFAAAGADNVTWVWCPNANYPDMIELSHLYPGDDYVDWTCMDGYNKGANPAQPDRWKSFQQIFGATYRSLLRIAPIKPIMIAETASTEMGGSKAEWITDALSYQLPVQFPQVAAFVWFNWNADGMDWVIETSPSSQRAFAAAISSSYYAANEFAHLATSPIPPVSLLP